MSVAMMVGYAKEGHTLAGNLAQAIARWRLRNGPDSRVLPCRKSKATASREIVHITKHNRLFRYPETDDLAPDISILTFG